MRFWPYHPSNQPPHSSPQSQEASEHQRRRVESYPVAPKNIESPDLPPIMRFGSPQSSEVSAQRDWKKPKQAIATQALQAVSDKDPSPVRTKCPPVDAILLTATLVLIAFGLLSVLSASAWEAAGSNGNSFAMVGKQTVFMLLGLLLMRVASLTPLRVWQQWSAKLGIVVAVLIGLTIFVGTTANGSSRWLMLPGGIQFQPSEFAKLSGILLVAQAIVSKPSMRHWHTLFSLALLGLIVVLVLKQPNVSMVILLGLTSAAMAFVSSGLSSWFYVMGLPLVGGFLWNKIQHTDYLSKRLIGWLNPWGDPQGTGYNLIQSWYAIGNGGILGRGWGQSLQKLNALPFPHTDFIYSIVCEELGLLGSLAMVVLFGIIAWRGIHIALTCRDRYGQILAFGITFSIVIQALLNMSVAVGLLPVTGVTLPLVSYGGTSILVTLLMLGVLMHCSRLTRKSF